MGVGLRGRSARNKRRGEPAPAVAQSIEAPAAIMDDRDNRKALPSRRTSSRLAAKKSFKPPPAIRKTDSSDSLSHVDDESDHQDSDLESEESIASVSCDDHDDEDYHSTCRSIRKQTTKKQRSKHHSPKKRKGEAKTASPVHLPLEILVDIFSRLHDPSDLARLEIASKHFLHVIREFKLWDKLDHPILQPVPELKLSMKQVIRLTHSDKCDVCEYQGSVLVWAFRKRLCSTCARKCTKSYPEVVDDQKVDVDLVWSMPYANASELPGSTFSRRTKYYLDADIAQARMEQQVNAPPKPCNTEKRNLYGLPSKEAVDKGNRLRQAIDKQLPIHRLLADYYKQQKVLLVNHRIKKIYKQAQDELACTEAELDRCHGIIWNARKSKFTDRMWQNLKKSLEAQLVVVRAEVKADRVKLLIDQLRMILSTIYTKFVDEHVDINDKEFVPPYHICKTLPHFVSTFIEEDDANFKFPDDFISPIQDGVINEWWITRINSLVNPVIESVRNTCLSICNQLNITFEEARHVVFRCTCDEHYIMCRYELIHHLITHHAMSPDAQILVDIASEGDIPYQTLCTRRKLVIDQFKRLKDQDSDPVMTSHDYVCTFHRTEPIVSKLEDVRIVWSIDGWADFVKEWYWRFKAILLSLQTKLIDKFCLENQYEYTAIGYSCCGMELSCHDLVDHLFGKHFRQDDGELNADQVTVPEARTIASTVRIERLRLIRETAKSYLKSNHSSHSFLSYDVTTLPEVEKRISICTVKFPIEPDDLLELLKPTLDKVVESMSEIESRLLAQVDDMAPAEELYSNGNVDTVLNGANPDTDEEPTGERVHHQKDARFTCKGCTGLVVESLNRAVHHLLFKHSDLSTAERMLLLIGPQEEIDATQLVIKEIMTDKREPNELHQRFDCRRCSADYSRRFGWASLKNHIKNSHNMDIAPHDVIIHASR
ncbi:hypothetical protein SeMB42_g04104 [Synchytrium endobioticum]|uniref:F-box domain-containing protein n=2 Tax=Synchytrium endobioticum TaxID=286115 RepID=A0A507D0X4_9FUNG|nr:hypothetical protein SeMB42_g04104 [Synchytrium endobioticum]